MRVLVTGLNGFTGCYLRAELEARGHEIVPFDADIADKDAVLRAVLRAAPDAVINLAAIAFVGSGGFDDFYRVNQLGAFNLLEALALAAPKALVLLVSSANIYGNRAEGLLDENTPPDPINHYAISKWAMELGARQWLDRLAIICVRPFNYTGVGQEDKYLIPKIVSHFQRRAEVIELGNLDVRRDFGDVRSVAAAYAELIEMPQSAGQVLNVGTGKCYSLSDIILMVSNLSGHEIKVQINPAFVRANEVKVLAGDSRRLHDLLPQWEPRAIEDTLQWMLQSKAECSPFHSSR